MRTALIFGVTFLCGCIVASLCKADHMPAAELEARNSAVRQIAGGQTGSEAGEMPHMDHQPKHHGIFFMAPDSIHHIEGVLLPSNDFRLYVYDEYTKPLSAEKLRKSRAYLTVEGADPSPSRKVELTPSGETLDASLGKDLKLPAVLKLTVLFGDLPSGKKAEEFSFHFRRYSSAQAGEKDTRGSSEMPMSHPM